MGAANTPRKIASPHTMIIKNTLRKEVSSGYFRREQRLCMGIWSCSRTLSLSILPFVTPSNAAQFLYENVISLT